MAIEEDEVDRGDLFDGEEDEEYEDDDEVEELEEEEVDEEEEEEPLPKKEPRIPKSRFDEVIQQREDARERNLWLEEQLEKLISQSTSQQRQATPQTPEVPSYDYDAAEEEYINLIISGDITKATKLRGEINTFRQKELAALINSIEGKATDNAKSQSSFLLEQERFVSAIVNMEEKYPFLDNKHKLFNEEAVETVNTLLAGYTASGKSKVEALQLAIKKVLPLYDKKGESRLGLGEQRKADAGKKAADASRRQPARQKSAARTSDMGKVDIQTISERDFSKLTAKEKSILRGD